MQTTSHSAMSTEPRQDIYSRITSAIVADLERGVRPWTRRWSGSYAAGRITRPVRHNGLPYRGINVLALWAAANAQGFSAPTWMTYRQALELNAQVRKGEKGSLVVYANSVTRTESGGSESDLIEREIRYLKGYTVFNVEQIEGLPVHYQAVSPTPQADVPVRIARAEQFFAAIGADVSHGGSRAFYRPSTDQIVLPVIEAFADAECYYATRAHETVHWTAAPSRLTRDFGSRRFGSEGYAVEELVAELGAAFLCADLGLSLEPRADHTSYIASWLHVLKHDNRAVFTAASHAQRAADYLHGLQRGAAPDNTVAGLGAV